MKPGYDTTLARIAGNIAAGLVSGRTIVAPEAWDAVADDAVALAQRIVTRCRVIGARGSVLDDAGQAPEVYPNSDKGLLEMTEPWSKMTKAARLGTLRGIQEAAFRAGREDALLRTAGQAPEPQTREAYLAKVSAEREQAREQLDKPQIGPDYRAPEPQGWQPTGPLACPAHEPIYDVTCQRCRRRSSDADRPTR